MIYLNGNRSNLIFFLFLFFIFISVRFMKSHERTLQTSFCIGMLNEAFNYVNVVLVNGKVVRFSSGKKTSRAYNRVGVRDCVLVVVIQFFSANSLIVFIFLCWQSGHLQGELLCICVQKINSLPFSLYKFKSNNTKTRQHKTINLNSTQLSSRYN